MRNLSLASAALGGLAALAQDAPAPELRRTLDAGSAAVREGRLNDALRLFTEATREAPSFSGAFLGLGLTELRLGQTVDAEAALRHALALDPRTPGGHLFLGIAESQGGDADAGAADLRQELAAQPDNVEALTWLGIVELGANRPELAAPPLGRAVSLAPNDGQLLYYQGRAHSLMAEQAYRALYRLDPDSALVHRALGESLSASGQPEKAVAEFEAALKKQPGNADLLEALGDEDQKLSRFDAALAAYREELKLNPRSAVALYNAGKIAVERGKASEGVPLLRQAAEAHASPAPTSFYLGWGLAELGQDAEAERALQASLAAAPTPFIAQSAWFQLGRLYARAGRKAEADKAFAEVRRLKNSSSLETPHP